MNKILSIILLLFCWVSVSVAQEEEQAAQPVKKDMPVRTPWESGYLIDARTSVIPAKKTL